MRRTTQLAMKRCTTLGIVALVYPFVPYAQTVLKSSPRSAEAFVRRLYKRYTADELFSSSGKEKSQTYSSSALSLLKADERKTPAGYEGSLDADPICQCQDADGLHLVALKSTATAAGKVQVAVTLKLLKDSPVLTKLRLDLIHEPAGWRVDDVLPADGPSLRQLLKPASK
jgi:hypothetical protein